MRYSMVISVLLCTCMMLCSLHAQENPDSSGMTSCIPVRPLTQENIPFQAGEQMSFVLHYKWGAINSDVGHATVGLDTLTFNGEKVYLCSVYGKTTKWYDLFFKVREDFKSWFTVDDLRPMKFTRDTFEGNYEARNTYVYDWDSEQPHIIADVYSSSSGQRYPEIPLTPCTFDLPALFYFARNMDMDAVEPGKRYPMTFAIDDDVYNVYFIMHGKETVKVKGFGTVRTIRFTAKLLAGEVFTGEEDMTIWISDDENRIPVYFEAPLLVGKAIGRMTGYGGLKYPFTSFQGKKRR